MFWLDYIEEATSYHTLDLSMWGAVKYRRTFSADSCNVAQSVAIDHKKSPSVCQTSIPIHSDKGFFSESSLNSGISHKLLNLLIGFVIALDVIAPVSFVMLSYMIMNGH